MSDEIEILDKGAQTDAPVYLLVADQTEEFEVALQYAIKMAKFHKAQLAVIHVMEKEDFQTWGEVQEHMHREYRQNAEALLRGVAEKVNAAIGSSPTLYLEEDGTVHDAVRGVIDRDTHISKLILAASTEVGNPGPLVAYFTGKGLLSLRVPVTLVPGNIQIEALEDLE